MATSVSAGDITINIENTEMHKYREAFRLFDVNNTGDITVEELKEVLGSLGYDVNDDKLNRRLDEVDVRKNGVINFDEFMKVVSCEMVHEEEAEIMRLFRVFDSDRKGYVTREKLQTVLKKLGLNFTEQQINLMMEAADTAQDGRINYEEFVDLNRNGLLTNQQPKRRKCRLSVCISNVEIDKYREAFRLFDTDSTNKISIDELEQVLKNLGFETGITVDFKQRLKEIDRRGNGVINFDEFIDCIGDTKHDTEEREMLTTFKMFDVEGNGYIYPHELRAVLKKLGFVFTDKQVDAMIQYADVAGDGRINFEEFLRVNDFRLHHKR